MVGIDHRQLAEHAFAIINPLQVDRSHWDDLPTIVLTPALSVKSNSMPVLVDLAALDEAQRVNLLIRAEAWDKHHDAPFFSLLLKAEAVHQRLATHLTCQLVVSAPDGAKALLRWYDPRVFQHLRWLLTVAQLRRLGGPATAWTWRDPALCWHTHDVQTETGIGTRLRLTAEQWSRIGRFGVLNHTIAQLHRNAPETALDEETFQRLDAYLERAYDTHKMSDEADARLFAEQGIRYPDIHRHPEIQRRLMQMREHSITYVGACYGLDPTALDNGTPEREPQSKEAMT